MFEALSFCGPSALRRNCNLDGCPDMTRREMRIGFQQVGYVLITSYLNSYGIPNTSALS